jgi:DNA-directed RNA polymerase subunit RPC12/RpoP
MSWKPEYREPAESITTDAEDEEGMFCPYCGIQQGENPDNIVSVHLDSENYECDECEKEFYVTKFIKIEYVTER